SSVIATGDCGCKVSRLRLLPQACAVGRYSSSLPPCRKYTDTRPTRNIKDAERESDYAAVACGHRRSLRPAFAPFRPLPTPPVLLSGHPHLPLLPPHPPPRPCP